MNDFLKILGYKALDSRMKRISDRIAHDVRKLYKELDIDVEPNWYLLFMLLQEKDKVSIVYIAEQLGYAHPSVVIIVQKMKKRGYLKTEQAPSDKRKQLVSLTEKAKVLIPKLQTIWESWDNAMLNILKNDLGILTYLDNIDEQLERDGFYSRFKREYLNTRH